MLYSVFPCIFVSLNMQIKCVYRLRSKYRLRHFNITSGTTGLILGCLHACTYARTHNLVFIKSMIIHALNYILSEY